MHACCERSSLQAQCAGLLTEGLLRSTCACQRPGDGRVSRSAAVEREGELCCAELRARNRGGASRVRSQLYCIVLLLVKRARNDENCVLSMLTTLLCRN